MELTQKQLEYIRKHVEEGALLEDVLTRKLPDARIAIIRGYDSFSNHAYTQGAFFNAKRAEKIMAKITPTGDPEISDAFHILIVSVEQLNNRVWDLYAERPLDGVDRMMIYEALEMDLKYHT